MSNPLAGVYPATVVGTRDVAGTFQFQVSIAGQTANNADTNLCPWAPYCGTISSGGSGDFLPYSIGDVVLVAFLYGKPAYPIILGGLPRGNTENQTHVPVDYLLGMQSDSPVEQQRALNRWQRVDRAGNMFEMSTVGDEVHVSMRSGGAEVKVTAVGNMAYVHASGSVEIKSEGRVVVNAGHASVEANVVDVRAAGKELLTQLDDGRVNIQGSRRVTIGSYDDITHQTGSVNIGGEYPRFLDLPTLTAQNPIPFQSLNTSVRAKIIGIGCQGGVPWPTFGVPVIPPVTDFETTSFGVPTVLPLLPTQSVNIRAALSLDMACLGQASLTGVAMCNISSSGLLMLSGAGAIYQSSYGPIIISSTSAVTISAPLITMTNAPIL